MVWGRCLTDYGGSQHYKVFQLDEDSFALPMARRLRLGDQLLSLSQQQVNQRTEVGRSKKRWWALKTWMDRDLEKLIEGCSKLSKVRPV